MVRTAKIERAVERLDSWAEIKAAPGDEGIVEGYLNFFKNTDFQQDVTQPGAFKRTLKEALARKSAQKLDFLYPLLWDHNFSILPIGGIFDAWEDNKGLFIRAQLNRDTQMGAEVYASCKAGFTPKMSMGYKTLQSSFTKDEKSGKTIRNLEEVQLLEGSIVTFPANDLAQITSVKRRNFYMPNKLLTKQEMPAITKDYAASYEAITQQDWRSDLWNLWFPLCNEFIIAQMGDTPIEDAKTAISQFTEAAIAYMQRGVELNMAEFLQPDDDSGNSPSMYMSADDNPETKAGRTISDANHKKIAYAADGIMTHESP